MRIAAPPGYRICRGLSSSGQVKTPDTSLRVLTFREQRQRTRITGIRKPASGPPRNAPPFTSTRRISAYSPTVNKPQGLRDYRARRQPEFRDECSRRLREPYVAFQAHG